ncbi:MAG: hypothetical protein C0594_12775, partial [Marinilabiliales bacterium]
YYVLKQVDFDGTASYSDMVAVEVPFSEKPEFTIYPNHITESFFYIETRNFDEAADIVIHDVYGRTVSKTALNTNASWQVVNLDADAGIYFITLEGTAFDFDPVKVIKK